VIPAADPFSPVGLLINVAVSAILGGLIVAATLALDRRRR
jgi:subtilase family serine protease